MGQFKGSLVLARIHGGRLWSIAVAWIWVWSRGKRAGIHRAVMHRRSRARAARARVDPRGSDGAEAAPRRLFPQVQPRRHADSQCLRPTDARRPVRGAPGAARDPKFALLRATEASRGLGGPRPAARGKGARGRDWRAAECTRERLVRELSKAPCYINSGAIVARNGAIGVELLRRWTSADFTGAPVSQEARLWIRRRCRPRSNEMTTQVCLARVERSSAERVRSRATRLQHANARCWLGQRRPGRHVGLRCAAGEVSVAEI